MSKNAAGPSLDRRTLVVGSTIVPNAFDPDQFANPVVTPSPDNFDVHTQTYDRLMAYPIVQRGGTRLQDTGWPIGELVERWDSDADGLRHRLRLREATSCAGNRLTAEDVVWSWRKAYALREVGRWAAFMGSVSRGLDGVQALDDRTVEFTLEQPNLLFPHVLTIDVPPIVDSTEARRHATDDDPWALRWLRENPAGFGPYRIERQSEADLVLRAHEGYWGGPAAIERIVYRRFAPDHDRVASLVAGEVDILYAPSPAEIARLRRHDEVNLFEALGSAHLALQLDARQPPFDDPALRRALACAVPYQAIIHEVYLGAARPWRGVLPDSHPGAIECLTVETDLDLSRRLLRGTGRSTVAASLFCDGAVPALVTTAEWISRSAALVGFDLEVVPLATKEFKARQNAFAMPLAVDHDSHRCNEIGYGLPHDFGDRRHGITNWVQYRNETVNGYIEQAERERNPARRLTLYRECQRLIEADVPWAFIAQPSYVVATRRGLTGLSWQARGAGRQRVFDIAWVDG